MMNSAYQRKRTAFIQMKNGLFDEAGGIGPASKSFLQAWMDRYVAWVKLHATTS